ncbi:MAG: zinc-dependent metalloprotease [Bdellovibrionales bacterium]|nr:zinc-dependent metalloprotease [Bdellovibrionales bacterium]
MHYSRGIRGQLLVFVIFMTLLGSCSWDHKRRAPMLEDLQVQPQGQVPLEKLGPEFETQRVRTTAKLIKSRILDREFLYGVDIQNSSMKEGDDLLPAMSLGHYKARFKISADKLQLVTDSSSLYESTINHPERLIHEWKITTSDATSLSVVIDRPSPLLATFLSGPGAPRERTSWLRAAEFEKKDNLLMLQTSIETEKGEVVEFLESLFPREQLISTDAPLYIGADFNPYFSRFGFLSSVTVFFDDIDGNRQSSMVANRFGWSPATSKEPIYWYVTRNIPDELLPIIGSAVEGWNRYSQKMWGKDILRFLGKLPEDVQVGDPRYNVIYWDTVDEAGAAYETQASDPETGIQSHSLIYLPKAWLRLGEDAHRKSFPSAGLSSDDSRPSQRSFLGRAIRARCMRSSFDKPYVHLESLDGVSSETFGKELLKQTLFHEVGHALGLDHNFKGSLAFDPDQPQSPPTHSVMDYNDFFVERAIFDSLDSSTGLILEYDRQALSALYNNGKDIAPSDPVLPNCNDDDSDAFFVDGFTRVDPLCNRYDLGQDPSITVERTMGLITGNSAKVGPILSLPLAIQRYQNGLQEKLEEVLQKSPETLKTQKQIAGLINQAIDKLDSLQGQYFENGHESLMGSLGSMRKSLFPFRAGIQNEENFRRRVIDTIDFASSTRELPAAAKQSRDALILMLREWTKSTPWARSEMAAGRNIDDLLEQWLAEEPHFSSVRALALSLLRLPSGTTLHFDKNSLNQIDLEEWATSKLVRALTSSQEAFVVRKAASQSLSSFAKTEVGAVGLREATLKLQQELRQSSTARQREELRQLLDQLSAPPPGER